MPGAGWSDWWGRAKRWRAVLRRVVVSWDGKGLGGYGRRLTQVGLNCGGFLGCFVVVRRDGVGKSALSRGRGGTTGDQGGLGWGTWHSSEP